MKIKSILIFVSASILFLTIFGNLWAQNSPGEPFGQYDRKSISYIPAVYIPRSEAYKMKTGEIEFLIGEVRNYIEMPRFDFNRLPESITDEFVRRAQLHDGISPDEMEDLLNKTVVPVIVDILNTEMEMRARDLVTDQQQQQFIATKAQSYGITAAQLETVLNSAYLYVPYVDEVKFSEDKKMYTCDVKGGLLWYHIDTASETPRVESILKQETHSLGKGKEDNTYRYSGKKLKGDEFALYTAVSNFARNLQVATQEIPAFKLSAQVAYVDRHKIDFNLGKKEGIKVDDGFYVTEQVMNADGSLKQKRVGFVRTTKVANNKTRSYQNSQAVAVMGRGYAQGMALVEHPRLPIDIVVRPRAHMMDITPGHVGPVYFYDEYSGATGGIDLEAHYHIGRWFDVPMLLFSAGGTISFVPSKINLEYKGYSIPTLPALYQIHLGLTRKYFYRRVGWTLAAKFGTAFLSVSEKFGDNTVSLTNHTIGGIFESGLEYVITPDFYIGIYGGYQFYPESIVWTLDINNDSYPLPTSNEDRPAFNANGATIGIYFHYQPPSLPFDPFNFIRGISGI